MFLSNSSALENRTGDGNAQSADEPPAFCQPLSLSIPYQDSVGQAVLEPSLTHSPSPHNPFLSCYPTINAGAPITDIATLSDALPLFLLQSLHWGTATPCPALALPPRGSLVLGPSARPIQCCHPTPACIPRRLLHHGPSLVPPGRVALSLRLPCFPPLH